MNHIIPSMIPFVDAAIVKARAVERSHAKHHQSLMVLVSQTAKLDSEMNMLAGLSMYMVNRIAESPDSLCTEATKRWLNTHFGVKVDKDGIVSRGRDWKAKGLNETTFAAARDRPWYAIARDELVKPWHNPRDTLIRQYATGLASEDITLEELREMFLADMVDEIIAMSGNEKVVEKAAKIKALKLAA